MENMETRNASRRAALASAFIAEAAQLQVRSLHDRANEIAAETAALRRAKHQRHDLSGSSAMIRIQRICDRNEEMNARANFDQAIAYVLDGVPCVVIPVEVSPNSDKIVCCVFVAARPRFGQTCMKDVEVIDPKDENNVITIRAERPHDFRLVDKHFGVYYEAVPGKRMIINASAYLNKKAA